MVTWPTGDFAAEDVSESIVVEVREVGGDFPHRLDSRVDVHIACPANIFVARAVARSEDCDVALLDDEQLGYAVVVVGPDGTASFDLAELGEDERGDLVAFVER